MTSSSVTSKASNDSGIIPMQFKIIVAVEKSPEKSDGGIYLPDRTQDIKQFEGARGTIVAVGPAAFSDHDQYPEGTRVPEVGDHIWFDKHAGHQIKTKRDQVVTYRVMEDTDIVGIVDDVDTAMEFAA